MDMGATWQRSADGIFARLAQRVRDAEGIQRDGSVAQLRQHITRTELADATARAVHIMGDVGVATMGAGQRVRSAAWFYAGAGVCESPLEVLMLAGLMAAAWAWTGGVVVRLPGYDVGQIRTGGHTGTETCIIAPQGQVGGHRVDFFVTLALAFSASGRVDGPLCEPVTRSMVVECDGRAFHDRTQEQAQRDRVRDRRIQHALGGGLLLHYGGAEIWADPCHCAVDAMQTLWKVTHHQFEEQHDNR